MTWHDISVCCCQKFSGWSVAIWVYQFSIHEFLGVPSSSYIVPLSLRCSYYCFQGPTKDDHQENHSFWNFSKWYQSYCFDLFFNTIPSIHLVLPAHEKSLTLHPNQQPASWFHRTWAEEQVPELLDGACVSCLDIFWQFLGGAPCYTTQQCTTKETEQPTEPTNQ